MQATDPVDKSGDEIKSDIDYSNLYGGLQINLPMVNSSSNTFNIEVQGFNDLKVQWLGEIVRQYEDHLWMKFVAIDGRRKYKCFFCYKELFHFTSIKNHLLSHLQIYPFKCFACKKKYSNNNSLRKHNKSKHIYDLTNTETENKVMTNTETENKVMTNTETENKVMTNTETENKVITNTETENKVITNTETENKVITNTETENKVITNTETENKVITNTETENKVVDEN